MITEDMYSQLADFKNYTVSTKDFKKPSTLTELIKRAHEIDKK